MIKADIDRIEQLQHESARSQASRAHHRKKREEAEARLAVLEGENARLREALVTAMIPIEAILLSGADAAHCQSVRDALHDAVSTARASLSTAKQGASDAD